MNKNEHGHLGRAKGYHQATTDPANRKYPQYDCLDEFVEDTDKFNWEVQHHKCVTPEKRACVYGIPESVPYTRGWRG